MKLFEKIYICLKDLKLNWLLNLKIQMKYNFFYLLFFLFSQSFYVHLFAQNVTIVQSVKPDNSVLLSYKKQSPGSLFLLIHFTNVTNCYVSDYKTVISYDIGDLLTLMPLNQNSSIGYSYRYFTIMGKPNPKVDSLFHYVLPFKKGKKHKIVEASFLGEKYFEQEKPKNWKSYVINSKNADTICNMRKGIVVKVDDQYQSSSLEMVYTSKRNTITVEHSDGTLATYKGFKNNALFVKLGQTVYPHTELGVMEQFNANNYRADISISFLYDKDFNLIEKEAFLGYKNKYEFVTPYFVTENGSEKLVSNKEYTSVFSDIELLKEFSKSEKKKYLKDSTFFK